MDRLIFKYIYIIKRYLNNYITVIRRGEFETLPHKSTVNGQRPKLQSALRLDVTVGVCACW